MSKLSNSILMLKLLSNGTKLSIKELSKKLEVSERMIRNYKDELEKAGIYIDTIYGPYGGYVLNSKVYFNNVYFSKSDLDAIDKIIELDLDYKEKLINIKRKMLLHSVDDNTKNVLQEKYIEKYNLINKAIKDKQKLRIYFKSKNGEKERVITPIEIFVYNNKWFVIVEYAENVDDIRYLNFDRLDKIKII